jgi:hypothetical protein
MSLMKNKLSMACAVSNNSTENPMVVLRFVFIHLGAKSHLLFGRVQAKEAKGVIDDIFQVQSHCFSDICQKIFGKFSLSIVVFGHV